jgi:hypothetical protein
MLSSRQVILFVTLFASALGLIVPASVGNSDLNHPKLSTDNDSTTKKPGTIQITIQCPDGSNAREVATQEVEDTSIEAVTPFFKYWNKLALEAQANLQCKDGQKGLIRMDGLNYFHG